MIYSDAGQRIDDFMGAMKTEKSYRMATVTRLNAGRPIIRFFGESEESQKLYKYLQSYSPAPGDKVLTTKIGQSYVILGKVV